MLRDHGEESKPVEGTEEIIALTAGFTISMAFGLCYII